MTRQAEVVILGAGTAGLSALKEAQRYTQDVLLINAGFYGTTCARLGCMPSKSLIEVAHAFARNEWLASTGIHGTGELNANLPEVMAHVRQLRDRFMAGSIKLAEQLGERSLYGYAKFLDGNTLELNGERIVAKKIIIATGSRPFVPDAWQAFGDKIVTSDQVFELTNPGKKIGVVGLGAIGLELGHAFALLGCDVHGFTRGSNVAGIAHPEVNQSVIQALSEHMAITVDADVKLSQGQQGIIIESQDQTVEVDWVLASLGRRANTEQLGLENLGVPLNERGMPEFNPSTLKLTGLPIYFAGDVAGLRPLMHEAADEGHIAAYHALHPEAPCLARRTPMGIVFTEPQVGFAGKNYAQLSGEDFVVGSSSFVNQGRAVSAGRNHGAMAVFADSQTGKILGAEIAGPDAEHLLHLMAWGIQQQLSVNDMLQMPFYHPVVEEGLRTALKAARRELKQKRTQPDLPLCHHLSKP